jgi:hypothetical protein
MSYINYGPRHRHSLAAPRDLNWPNSERGVGHLEALGNALGEVASTTNRPGGHGNEEKNEFPRRICGGLSHMGSV